MQMTTAAAAPAVPSQSPHTWSLAVVCFAAGAAALAMRWIGDDLLRFGCGLVLCALFFGTAFVLRRAADTRWPLAFAFGVFALVQLLNNSLPAFVAVQVLHAPPTDGDPLAGTVSASVAVQLLETAIAILPVVVLTLLSGQRLESIYLSGGTSWRWLLAAIGFFVVLCVFVATRGAQRLVPDNAPFSLSLAPALLLVAISNGFEEEVLFRGLFLQKYTALFGARLANLVQALVFTFAHLGITYSSSTTVFLVLAVFPLAIATGYLMRKTNSVLVPSIVHAALDVPIYLIFLTASSGV